MNGLLERLRGWSSDPLCREAAAEIETLSLAFCNAVTRCEGAEATLSERTYERDTAVRAAQEQAQAVVDAHTEIARLRIALAFYADPQVYAPHPHGPAFDRRDLSYRARRALAQEEKP